MSACYKFGGVEVRPAERQIVVEGQPASVGARAFDVLMALIDRRDRVVTKDELLDIVWPGLIVEENNLQVQVSTLRKVLGARSVATIPGRGYRFTLTPETADAAVSDLTAPHHNLPAQLNRFIGREHEIGEVKRLFAGTRLVTLCSLGGTGKTRLSLQLAHELVNHFPDGVWFVELAPISDDARVVQAVAAVLGVQALAGGSLADALARFLRGRNLLLVLDNCEHVLRGTADLVKQMLQAASSVHILASSREALRVTGETVYPLSPLPTPDPRFAISTEILEQYDAVRLFLDRAAAANSAFTLTDANVGAVGTICRRLDGIPLAIELAAARMRALSVENIAARLDDRFRLLTGGDQTSAPRQQTLRASLDWSYDLLTFEEAVLLRRLAIFSGGWTLEAAEAITSGGPVGAREVVDLLTRLVEKSLVDIDAYGERYRLLETVREYALEKLHAAGEHTELRGRHLAYFVDFAALARSRLTGPEEAVWAQRLDVELENILAAHAFADVDRKLRLFSSIRHHLPSRGLFALAHRLASDTLAICPEKTISRVQALFDVGQIGAMSGHYAESRKYLEESLALATQLDDRRWISSALQPLGFVCLNMGDIAAARGHLQVAAAMALERGDDRNTAATLTALAHVHRVDGDMDAAANLYEEVGAYVERLGDRDAVAINLLNLAMALVDRSLVERAALVLKAIALGVEVHSRYVGLASLDVTAGLAALHGASDCCVRLFGAAEALGKRIGLRRDVADEAFIAPLVAGARDALGAASANVESAGAALPYETALEEARACLQRITAA